MGTRSKSENEEEVDPIAASLKKLSLRRKPKSVVVPTKKTVKPIDARSKLKEAAELLALSGKKVTGSAKSSDVRSTRRATMSQVKVISKLKGASKARESMATERKNVRNYSLLDKSV